MMMIMRVFQTADKLIRVFAEQIFYTGFIHADPHPGNGEIINAQNEPIMTHTFVSECEMWLISVLVRRGPDNKAELVLLDHGLYEYLSKR